MQKKLLLLSILLLTLTTFAQKEVQCGEKLSSFRGTLLDSSSTQARIKFTTGTKPKVGATGEVASISGDEYMTMKITIGRVKVIAVTDEQVTIEVLEKISVWVINGIEKNNFLPGTLVEFSEYKYDVPTLVENKFPSGKLKEKGMMQCGYKIGEWQHYHENGNVSAKYTCNDKGEIIGDYVEYGQGGNNKTMSGSYQNGKKSGLWTEYFEDRTIKSQGYYYNGEKTGKWIEHNSEGKKMKVKY